MALPPGVEQRGGRLIRVVPRNYPDGSERKEIRPVSLDPVEARKQRMDYFHPEFGWLREGYKLVTDRSVGSKMLDDSQAVAVPEEGRQSPARAESEEE